MSIASDLIRGHTDVIILAQLIKKDSYGYEINKVIQHKSKGMYELKEATLYTAFRRLEQAAYRAGGGNYLAPAETVGSFLAGRGALELGAVQPTYPRGVTPCDLGSLLPDDLSGALREGLTAFGRKLAAYRAPDAVLTGLETRTSSPVRLLRDKENLQCTGLAGLYPCGEGAGYAGGIMTAAVDGVRCAAELMKNWGPMAD